MTMHDTFLDESGGPLFRDLLETAPDAMVIIDEGGRIQFVNAQTEALFGYERAELLGRPVELLLPERFRGQHEGHRRTYTEAARVRPMGSGLALSGRHRDGTEFAIEVSLSPLRTSRGLVVSAAIRDIRERRQMEAAAALAAEELEKARAAAEAASAAKSEFLSSMSHELRTPLNAILGFAQLLQRDRKAPLTTRQKGMVDQVMKGGEHLLRLIDDVLDLARIESGNVSISTEPVGVGGVLTEVKATLDPMAARAGIEIQIAPLPDVVPMVHADRTRFSQILMNYGSNAIKYGRQGGHARFEVEVTAAEHVRITVVDDGMGIPEDKQDKLFQPFQRAGQETGPIEGTGIGLTITKRLAEMMDGKVGFRSVVGEGSSFWLELPVRAPPRAQPTVRAPLTPEEGSALREGDGPRYLVLYVEDNPPNIVFMQELISELDRVELITAPTAEIGIELARARIPNVIVMDINLPGMSGFDALSRLRAWPETHDIPVLALSAAAMDRDKRRAEQAGFHRYLTKPVRVAEFTEVLEALLTADPPAKG